jgi:NAD(P)-dependent dehydrogenase (short-subunit alcohol dehydrogenase family)
MTARFAIVTGASSGIGRACATRLAAHGFRVFGLSRTAGDVGSCAEHISTDVTDELAVRESVAHVLRRAARVDLLVNCAGYGLAGAVADTTIGEAQRQFDVNFFGSLRMCRAVIPTMLEQKAGLIVVMSSLGGLFGLPFQGLYSASKFALEGLTDAMRHELGPFGVEVVAVEPGDVRTDITRNRVRAAAAANSPHSERFSAALEVIERDEGNGVPPEDVAKLVERIWHSAKRRPRYVCGHASQTISARARRWLPDTIFEQLIAGHYAGRVPAAAPAGNLARGRKTL